MPIVGPNPSPSRANKSQNKMGQNNLTFLLLFWKSGKYEEKELTSAWSKRNCKKRKEKVKKKVKKQRLKQK